MLRTSEIVDLIAALGVRRAKRCEGASSYPLDIFSLLNSGVRSTFHGLEICISLYFPLEIDGWRSVIFAFENVIKEAAFPFLTIVSTPNLDALTCSVSWALVNLLKSTNILTRFGGSLSSSLKWIHQLRLVEYMVEAFDVQLRPLDRLTHLLIQNPGKFNLEDLDEIDFDTLFPLFVLLVNVPPTYNVEISYYHRLQKHFLQISKFMSNLIAHTSAKCPLFIEIVAVSLLPVFHEYIQALKNFPNIVTVDLLSNLCQFLMVMDSVQFPPNESMAVIACFTSAVGVLSSQANPLISKQSVEFQTMCLNAVICGVIALRKRLDWSTFGGSILSDLRIFIMHLNCELSRGITESILECIISTYGESSISACELIGALPWTSSVEGLLLAVVRWMERIVKLYILPEGVEVVRLADFQLLLARAILSTCESLGRDNQEVAGFCKERRQSCIIGDVVMIGICLRIYVQAHTQLDSLWTPKCACFECLCNNVKDGLSRPHRSNRWNKSSHSCRQISSEVAGKPPQFINK
ncbi:hypothetical protein ACTXT7_007535 [Hymenolepis weldensis]